MVKKMCNKYEKGKGSVPYYSKLNDKKWLEHNYLTLKKTTPEIAKEVGCVPSTVFFALKRHDIPRRGRGVALRGIKMSKSHYENVVIANRARNTSGSNHWNWKGGISDYLHPRHSAEWKEWRKKVYERDNYTCRGCGYEKGKTLNPHHILPLRDFPHLKYSLDNGITLCKTCHEKTMNKEYRYIAIFRSILKGDELLEYPERAISSQAEKGISRKVQRLEVESRTDSNTSTSVAPERDDIVRTLQECKEV